VEAIGVEAEAIGVEAEAVDEIAASTSLHGPEVFERHPKMNLIFG